MYKLNPEKQQKIKSGFFFSKQITFSTNQITRTFKASTTYMCNFDSNTSSGKGCNEACISKASQPREIFDWL